MNPQTNGMGAPMQQPVMQVNKSKAPWIVLAAVIILLIIAGVVFRDNLFGKQMSTAGTSQAVKANPSGYQAIFLTNGQVYFGKFDASGSEWVGLSKIYYLQVTQPPLQGSQQQGQAAASQAQPQLSLVKLGQELHGPVDMMHINKSQVLFWEDLKEDSRVVQAIKEYEANPQQSQPAK